VNAGAPCLEDAIALAAKAHRGQRYPSPEPEPYIFHPLRLMLRFRDPVDQMAAVLHDAIEDSDLEVQNLVEAGYSSQLATALDALTHRDNESYHAYIERVANNEVARRVKIADLDENLANNRRRPDAPGNAERIARYESALARLTASEMT
jgi:(p)ppGpp synthase/HD superfamily hydrolase